MYHNQAVSRFFRPEMMIAAAVGLLALFWAVAQPVFAGENDKDRKAFSGLPRVHSSAFDELYVKQGVDFGQYDKVIIGNVPVSFSQQWRREYRDYGDHVTGRDERRIEKDMARLLRDELVKEFTEEGRYILAEEESEGALLLSPSIVKLDINAPDAFAPTRKTNYVRSAGRATLSLDVFDSGTGELLMHVEDYRIARESRELESATRVSNIFEMRRIMSSWADSLHGRLSEERETAGQ